MEAMQRQQRTDGPQNTPSKAAASTKEPVLSDVMTTLQAMNSTMTSKLDGVRADVGLMREQASRGGKGTKGGCECSTTGK